MATYTYTKISAFAVDQYFGVTSVNALKNNLRAIVEEALGNPTSGGVSPQLVLGAVSDGGRITFAGTTAKYLKGDTPATLSELGTYDLALESTRYLQGDRVMLSCTNIGNATGDYYSNRGYSTAGNFGIKSPRAGSFLSLAWYILVSGYSGSGTMRLEARKNDSVVWQNDISVTGNGTYRAYASQARGTDTFAAADLLDLSLNKVSGTYTIDYSNAYAELVLD